MTDVTATAPVGVVGMGSGVISPGVCGYGALDQGVQADGRLVAVAAKYHLLGGQNPGIGPPVRVHDEVDRLRAFALAVVEIEADERTALAHQGKERIGQRLGDDEQRVLIVALPVVEDARELLSEVAPGMPGPGGWA